MLEILIVAFVLYAVLPRLAGFETIGRAIARARWWVVPVAFGLEAASLCSYAELAIVALRGVGASAPRGLVYRVNISGTGLGKALPGGTSAALPFSVRMLQIARVDPALGAAALAGSGLLASIVLAVLLPVAALIALAGGNAGGLALGVVCLAVAGGVVAAGTRPALRDADRIAALVERLADLVARGPLRRILHPKELAAAVGRAVTGAVLWAAASWLFDLAAFAIVAISVGRGVPLGGLPLAYVVGQMAAALPLTPGGVGVVESTMTAALVAQGVPAASATVTVLGWRLVSHWVPLIVGLTTFALRPRRLRALDTEPLTGGTEGPNNDGCSRG